MRTSASRTATTNSSRYHQSNMVEEALPGFRCSNCSTEFMSERGLDQHVTNCLYMMTYHPGPSLVDRLWWLPRPVAPRPPLVQPCPTCGGTFLTFTALRRHKSMHTGQKHHLCWQCPREFHLLEQLKEHLRRAHFPDGLRIHDSKPWSPPCRSSLVSNRTGSQDSYADQENRTSYLSLVEERPLGITLEGPDSANTVRRTKQLGMRIKQPGVCSKRSGMCIKQPGMRTKQRGMRTKQAGMRTKQPEMQSEQPEFLRTKQLGVLLEVKLERLDENVNYMVQDVDKTATKSKSQAVQLVRRKEKQPRVLLEVKLERLDVTVNRIVHTESQTSTGVNSQGVKLEPVEQEDLGLVKSKTKRSKTREQIRKSDNTSTRRRSARLSLKVEGVKLEDEVKTELREGQIKTEPIENQIKVEVEEVQVKTEVPNLHIKTELPDVKPVVKKESYVCHTCGLRFGWLSRLTRHELVHKTERPYVCTQCHNAFKYADNLQRHLLRVHRVRTTSTILMRNVKVESV